MKKKFKFLSILFIALLLSGCGFSLRQPQTMAPVLQNIYISTGSPNDPFIQTLRRILIANNVNIVDNPKEATATLNVLSIQATNTMASNGGINASGFYTAYLTVDFSVIDAQGNFLIKPNQLQQYQNFTSNATQVLSGNLTAAQLTNQMDAAIAQGIISQLASVKQPNYETQS